MFQLQMTCPWDFSSHRKLRDAFHLAVSNAVFRVNKANPDNHFITITNTGFNKSIAVVEGDATSDEIGAQFSEMLSIQFKDILESEQDYLFSEEPVQKEPETASGINLEQAAAFAAVFGYTHDEIANLHLPKPDQP